MDAMFRALHPWHSGMEISLMLEEIQVPPLVFPGIMYRAYLTAYRAREMAAFVEVDMQVQPLVLYLEGDVIHQPRRNQTQSQTEELLLIHPNPLRVHAYRRSYCTPIST